MTYTEQEISYETKDNKIKKIGAIIITLLVLLIPAAFMFNIIHDRKIYRNDAINAVSSSWAKMQILMAPEMSFTKKDEQNKTITEYLTLNNYNADIKINTEIRQKGIFKIPVYTADVTLTGDFINNFGNLAGKDIKIYFNVSDSTGFIKEPSFKINKEQPITVHETEYITQINSKAENIPFEIKYTIRGINEIYATPFGQNNNIKISGNWKDPSFEGSFLPSSREITNHGFSAEWTIPGIAASSFKDNGTFIAKTSPKAGVSLIIPVDNYRMTERILKYAFLFLSLTFLSYFIFEITSKEDRRIHPVQYAMLGGAMLIFYMLLLSLSEFIPFLSAYIISAIMIICLVTLYTYFIITKKESIGFAALIAAIMAILYSFLYILLTLQDFALLIGSLGLFMVISAIMYLTRNVNWYNK